MIKKEAEERTLLLARVRELEWLVFLLSFLLMSDIEIDPLFIQQTITFDL